MTKDRKTWTTLLLIVGVAIVAGSAGIGLRWWQSKHQPTTAIDAVRNSQRQQAINQQSPKEVEADVDKILKQGNVSNEDKYYLYFQKGSFAQQDKDYKRALENYKLAAAAKETDNIYEVMGVAATMIGDKEQAIKYYERAKELVPEDSPVRNSTRDRLQKNIDSLKGLPVQGPPSSLR